MTPQQIEAMKLALDLATMHHTDDGYAELRAKVRSASKEALAQPSGSVEQEPGAFYVYKPTLPRGHLGNVSDGDLPWVYDQDPSSGYSARMLVYTAPPAQLEQGSCGNCNGSGRMPRDPDIGTDQECFVCDGTGKLPKEPEQDGECKYCTHGCAACDARKLQKEAHDLL